MLSSPILPSSKPVGPIPAGFSLLRAMVKKRLTPGGSLQLRHGALRLHPERRQDAQQQHDRANERQRPLGGSVPFHARLAAPLQHRGEAYRCPNAIKGCPALSLRFLGALTHPQDRLAHACESRTPASGELRPPHLAPCRVVPVALFSSNITVPLIYPHHIPLVVLFILQQLWDRAGRSSPLQCAARFAALRLSNYRVRAVAVSFLPRIRA